MMLPPILLTLIWLLTPQVAEVDAEACGPRAGDRIPPRRFPVPVEMVRAARHF
jgi:hypothetical protein